VPRRAPSVGRPRRSAVRRAAEAGGAVPRSKEIEMRGPVVSILIVNWNTRERVMGCLASLPKDVPGLSREVIVIDNGSVDGPGEALARQADITLVRNERNVGYAAAVNQAYN